MQSIRHWITLVEATRNHNWVCFKDRKVVRRPGSSVGDEPPICPVCRSKMVSAGDQLPVPRATDRRAWRTFETEVKRRTGQSE